MNTFTDTAYYTLAEEAVDALLDKEGFLVALGAGEGTVKLATSQDDVIGVLFAKQKGNPHVNVRLLGKGGTVKIKGGGVIAKGARLIWGAGAKVLTQPVGAGTYRTIGIKLSQGNSANNDVIEVLDIVETRTVA